VSCDPIGSCGGSVGVVWREVLKGIFSTSGRLRALSNCRDPVRAGYQHEAAGAVLGAEEADHALRIAHELVWSEWIGGSLEQQQADLTLHICDSGEDVDVLLGAWSGSRPYLALIPDSASADERTLFTSNLSILLALLRNQYCLQRPRVFPKADNAVMGRTLEILRQEYAQPRLTLHKLAAKIGISERHLDGFSKNAPTRAFAIILASFGRTKRSRCFLNPLTT
jgi:hypothetical protein